VGFLSRLFSGTPTPLLAASEAATQRGLSFSTDIDSGVLYGTPTLEDYIYGRGKVTRKQALTVPAVKRARDIIAGSIGQMPVQLVRPDGGVEPWSLFDAPEEGTAPSVTWTRVAEDLLFDGVAWLRVTNMGWHGKPVDVVRLDPSTVTVQKKIVTYPWGTAEVWPDVPGLIRIDSPNAPLLDVGATAIRTCIAIAAVTRKVSGGMPPATYFTPADDADPGDDEDIQEMLNSWAESLERNTTPYIPAALKLNALGWNPEQLQLATLRDQAVLEISRLTSIDAEEFGVSTTSRTYANQQDRRRDRLDFTLGPFMTAIEGRLSLGDVTPRGFSVQIDPTSFLRSDDYTRAQTDALLISSGVVDREEARQARGLTGPAPELPSTTPAPQPASQEVPA